MTVAMSVTVCWPTAKLCEPPASGAVDATSFVDAKQIDCSNVLTQSSCHEEEDRSSKYHDSLVIATCGIKAFGGT